MGMRHKSERKSDEDDRAKLEIQGCYSVRRYRCNVKKQLHHVTKVCTYMGLK